MICATIFSGSLGIATSRPRSAPVPLRRCFHSGRGVALSLTTLVISLGFFRRVCGKFFFSFNTRHPNLACKTPFPTALAGPIPTCYDKRRSTCLNTSSCQIQRMARRRHPCGWNRQNIPSHCLHCLGHCCLHYYCCHYLRCYCLRCHCLSCHRCCDKSRLPPRENIFDSSCARAPTRRPPAAARLMNTWRRVRPNLDD